MSQKNKSSQAARLGNVTLPVKSTESGLQNLFTAYQPPEGVVGDGSERVTVNDGVFAGQFRNFNLGNDPATSLFEEGIGFPGYPYLAQLSLRGEYRLIVETRAEECVREWIEFKRLDDDIKGGNDLEAIKSAFKRHNIQDLIKRVLCTEGYFGLAHIYIDLETAQRDPEEKLAPLFLTSKKIKKGELRGFKLVDPNWVTPVTYNTIDPFEDDFYKPSQWWILGQQIHESRLISFVSQPVPDILKPAYNFGGVPFAFMAKPYVDNWLRTRQSVSDLIKSFSTMVLKTDLSQLLSPGCEELSKRAEMMAAYRDNRGLQIVDKETEELINVSASLSGLDKLQAQSQEHMAAISGIPLVKLLGITPSGLNASSDGEIRCFYDKIAAFQEALLRKPLQKIMNVIQLDLFGQIDENLTFEFKSLWQLDALQQAQVDASNATALGGYVTAGIMSEDEAREAIGNSDAVLFKNIDWHMKAPVRRDINPDDPAFEQDWMNGNGQKS